MSPRVEPTFRDPQSIDGFVDVTSPAFQRLFKGHAWSFGWKSNGSTDVFSFWHRHFIEAGPRATESDRKRFTPERFPVVGNVLDSLMTLPHLRNAQLLRAYANGLTYGLEGRIHTDSRDARDVTALIYANPFWVPAWAGETVFYRDDGTLISYRPVPGRLLLFNGTMQHVARPPSRDCPHLRVTLMYKFRLQEGELV